MRNRGNRKMLKAANIVISLAALFSFFYFGIYVGQATSEPEVIMVTKTQVEYQPVERKVIEYIEKPVVKYVNKIESWNNG